MKVKDYSDNMSKCIAAFFFFLNTAKNNKFNKLILTNVKKAIPFKRQQILTWKSQISKNYQRK
jgi:hypothetical protein